MARKFFTGGFRAACARILQPFRCTESIFDPSWRSNGNELREVAPALLEPLEQRRLLSSVSVSSGVLKIAGNSSSSNNLSVARSGSSNLVAKANSITKTYSLSSISKIEITGGDKADTITVASDLNERAWISGRDGDDTIKSGAAGDTIYGGNGNDSLLGYGGDDKIYGEAGNDTVDGGSGSDSLDGGAGTDVKRDSSSSSGSSGGSTPSSTNNDASAPSPVITATTNKTFQEGHSFHAHALASNLRSGNPNTARYHWDFGDAGSDYNVLVGYNAAHVYRDSGTYTVRLSVTNEAGKTATVSTTVTVQSSTRKRVHVSNDGNDSNDGSSSRPLRTFAKAASRLGDNVEILFKRGDTFDVNDSMNVRDNNVVIGTYGDGSRPVLRWRAGKDWHPIISTGHSRDHTIRDLTFDSIYTSQSNDDGLPIGVKPGGQNTSVINCQFLNLSYAINNNSTPTGLLAQDNIAPSPDDLRHYFAWVEGNDHVYLGNVVENVQSHVIRVGGANRLLIAHNDFSNPVENGTTRGTLTIHQGTYVYVANNVLSKGKVTIGPLGEGDGLGEKWARWQWGVFENNDINSIMIVEHGAERIMIRNNVVRSQDTFGIQIEGFSDTYNRGVKDVTIVNNTGINTADTGHFLKVSGKVDGITLENNLYLAPNLITGSYNTSPVSVYDNDLDSFRSIKNNVWPMPSIMAYAQGGINYIWPDWPDSRGYRTPSEWNAFGVVGTDYFVDTSYSGQTPSSSSFSANAGRKYAGVFTDKNGTYRPLSGDWTAGAVQV